MRKYGFMLFLRALMWSENKLSYPKFWLSLLSPFFMMVAIKLFIPLSTDHKGEKTKTKKKEMKKFKDFVREQRKVWNIKVRSCQ